MFKTLQELADLIDARVQGDATCKISGLAALENAGPKQLTFLFNPKYRKFLKTTKASAVLITEKDSKDYSGNALIVDDVQFAYAKIADIYMIRKVVKPAFINSATFGANCSISTLSYIGDNVVIGDNVKIADGCYIGPGCVIFDNCKIGSRCYLHANVVLYANTKIANDVIIHAGTVVGSDGFSNVKKSNKWVKIEQLGGVTIGSGVEIGANTTIDRGALDDTVIEDGVKLDNLIHIAHNVIIGANTVIAACTGIAGSARIGKNCVIAGASSINGHITIADNVVITGMAMITKSIASSGIYSSGTGFMPNNVWRKNAVRFQQLNKIVHRLSLLEKHLNLRNGN